MAYMLSRASLSAFDLQAQILKGKRLVRSGKKCFRLNGCIRIIFATVLILAVLFSFVLMLRNCKSLSDAVDPFDSSFFYVEQIRLKGEPSWIFRACGVSLQD